MTTTSAVGLEGVADSVTYCAVLIGSVILFWSSD